MVGPEVLTHMNEAKDLQPQLFGWTFFLHDDGWFLADRRSIIRAEGRVPNSGYRRPWWRRTAAPQPQEMRDD
jgi:hypothetical protein